MARFVELSTGSWSFGEVAAWLYRAARNELIDRSRKKQELSIFSLDPGASEEETEIAEVLLGSARTPEEEAMRALFWRRLQEALEALPAAQREVFVATELEGRSFKELAAESGVGVNTLLSRKHSAVLSLREALRDLHQEICTPDS